MSARLNEQLAAFEELLRQIDNTAVPENDFETANANSRPVQRDTSLNPMTASEVVASRIGTRYPPSSVKGLKTEAEKIQISLVDDSQAAKNLEAAAETEKKAKSAAQNALPAWHTMSTVTGAQTPLGVPDEVARGQSSTCLLYTSPSPRDRTRSRMPSSA